MTVRRVIASATALAIGGALAAPALGAPAFPLRLERPRGEEKVTVAAGPAALHLVFLATWCAPCLEELPRLADLESRFSGRGYRLVLIAVATRQTSERLVRFLDQTGPPGELLFDRAGAAQRALEVERIPMHVIVDAAGNVVLRSPRLDGSVEGALDALVDEGEPAGE